MTVGIVLSNPRATKQGLHALRERTLRRKIYATEDGCVSKQTPQGTPQIIRRDPPLKKT